MGLGAGPYFYEVFRFSWYFLISWVLTRSATCESTRIYQFITNNHVSFHLWWNENLLNYQNVSKYYDCRSIYVVSMWFIFHFYLHFQDDSLCNLMNIYLSIYLSIYLPICLSIYLSIYLSVYLCMCVCVCICACLTMYVWIYINVAGSVCLSIYACACVCAYVRV